MPDTTPVPSLEAILGTALHVEQTRLHLAAESPGQLCTIRLTVCGGRLFLSW
jgi:hypothetical protein